MSYRQYEPVELRKLQLVSTKILQEFDRVCTELEIPYYACAGTALGSVRHGGFIPWDDDIDVSMLRPDFERFLNEAPAAVGDDFEIVSGRNEPFFPACNANLALKGTLCVPEEFDSCPFRYPIGIGIYPMDRVSASQKTLKRQLRRTWFWARISFLRATPRPHLFIKGWRRTLVSAACHIAYWGMRILHISPVWIHRNWEKAATLAESEDVNLFADFTDMHPLDWSITREEMFPLKRSKFESIEINLPNAIDAILTRGYGDYMQLPPEEDRKNHYPSVLDFGRFN